MNLDLYNKVRAVPKEALKEIQAGRLKGKSDINPMWRIKALTEQFGICGIGWKYTITKQWIEQGASGEISAFVNIDLYIKSDGQWSEAIPGTGGSAFVANERNGLYTSDECFKMALTDAISVACKALGFGADVYWSGDRTKYDTPTEHPAGPEKKSSTEGVITEVQVKELEKLAKELKGYERQSYWDFLKGLEKDGLITSQYPLNKEKKVQWTSKDYEEIKNRLEMPF